MAVDFEIDDSELDEWLEKLEYFENHFPKETRRVMSKVGNEAKKIIKKEAKKSLKKKTGNYLKSIKKSNTYKTDRDEWTVKVHSDAPHAHLIEHGHKIVKGGKLGKGGKEIGFVRGKKIFKKAGYKIEKEYTKIVAEKMDEELKKI
jgi:hypothetical protein